MTKQNKEPLISDLSSEQLNNLLTAITEENGLSIERNKIVDYHRPWLKQAYTLAWHTGMTIDELKRLQWCHFYYEGIFFIELKVNSLFEGKTRMRFKTIPLLGCPNLPIDLGYKTIINHENFVFANEVKNREIIGNILIRSFQHFGKIALLSILGDN